MAMAGLPAYNEESQNISLFFILLKLEQQFFQTFCDQVISLDSSIRFAGIADEDGKILAVSERKGLKPLLTPEERAQYAITAATRQYTRLRWEYLLGKIYYASSHYASLIRATIPITNDNSKLSYVLLLSFDVDTENFHEIIMKKIIPLVKKNTTRLLKEVEL
jgi:hypothetical protein